MSTHTPGRRSLLALPLLLPVLPARASTLELRWRDSVLPLDIAALDARGRVPLTTHTPWTRGPQVFEGASLRDLLPTGAHAARQLTAIALDDFRAVIPMADVRDHGLFLAWRRNGDVMPVRDRGPFWLVYPWSQRPAIDTPEFHRRSAWQLRAILVDE